MTPKPNGVKQKRKKLQAWFETYYCNMPGYELPI